MVADEFEMSSSLLSQTFKHKKGINFYEYVKEKRLSKGVALLEEGLSIIDVATKIGYSSSHVFIRLFKESYGVTPGQYKKQKNELKTM